MRIYVAGPMRGYPRFNFDAFDEAQAILEELGHLVVSPAEMDRQLGFDPEGTLEEQGFSVHEAMQRDIAEIVRCGGIALLPGWEKSHGARTERFVAETTGRSVWMFDAEVEGALRPAPEWDGRPDVPLTREEAKAWHPSMQPLPPLTQWKAHPLNPTAELPKQSPAEQHEAFREAYREELSQAAIELNRTYGLSDDGLPVSTAEAHEAYLERYRKALDIGLESFARPPDEVRVTDPTTGGAKGQKVFRTDLLPADALLAVAEHFGRGAQKYEDRNWEKGYAWSLSYAALLRHLLAFWGGEDHDEETGSLHLQAVGFHALALLAFSLRGAGTDDRPPSSIVP